MLSGWQAKIYGLGELEAESLAVLSLIAQQTERGKNLDSDQVERAKVIVERRPGDDRGQEAPDVDPFRKNEARERRGG